MFNEKMGTAHQDPNAIGVRRYMTREPKYIGWRMMEYGPVVMTFWPSTTSIVRDA
jgi:hypothetical protein